MALTSKKQNQLTKEVKDLVAEVERLSNVEVNLEKSKAANQSLMKENVKLQEEIALLKKEVANLRKGLFLMQENNAAKQDEPKDINFKTDKDRILYLLNRKMTDKKILMLSGKEAVNHTILKYFPSINKVMTSGQRNFKAETINSLDLLIVITDFVGHSETGKAETLAKKNNIPIIRLKKISLTTLTEKLCALYKIK